ncbi:MAG: sulfotransferase-like protein [Acidimicrobiales bacterium]|nr:sulfotransferase-like protein [Acidimicrobiales bacterium]
MTGRAQRVLYVAGTGRSGSTLLARILDRADGVFAAGELRYLWQRGVLEDRLCGCGKPFSACEFWGEVLDRAFGGPEKVDARGVMTAQRTVTRLRHVPRLLGGARPATPDGYLDQLSRLYRAVGEVSGCELVVDSSKLPSYGFVLGHAPGLDVRTVHLVRDPRGTAYSWARGKAKTDSDGGMQRMSVLKSSSLWLAWNAAAPRLFRDPARYCLVRYEDLVAAPRDVVDAILAFAGHTGDGAPFVGERTVALARSHTVAGNPNRLEAGPVELRADQTWLRALGRPQRALVTAVTTPLLGRFDYPLVVKQGPLRDLTVPQ